VRFPFFLPAILTKSAFCHDGAETTLFSRATPRRWNGRSTMTKQKARVGKKYSILMICIDAIPNLHQIGELCTVHKRTHMIFMNSICNPC
jgi:hypothetical protein